MTFLSCLYRAAVVWLVFTPLWGEAQTLVLGNEKNFRNCVEGDDSEFRLVIENRSDVTAFQEGTYSIDWGDSKPGENLTNVNHAALNTSHLYTEWGVYELKVSAVSKQSGRRVEQVYQVINLSNPAVGFERNLSGTPCVNSEAEIYVTNYNSNSAATTYTLDFGDGSTREYTQAQIVADGGKVLHQYEKTHCQLNKPKGITIRVTAKNECGFTTSMDFPNYMIILPPTADFDYKEKPGCTEREVQFINQTDGGLGKDCQPLNLTYEWDFGKTGVGVGQENVKNPLVVYNEDDTYQVTLEIKNSNGFKCAYVKKTLPVRIIKSVKAGFIVDKDSGCDPLGVSFTDKSAGEERKYQWTVVEQGVNGGYTPTGGLNQANVHINFHYGTYKVTQIVSNNCSTDSKDTTISVKKDPEIVEFKALPALCPGSVLSLPDYITYAWYNNTPDLKWEITPASGWILRAGTTLTSEKPQIEFTQPGKYTLKVTLKGAGCGGTKLVGTQLLTVYDPSVKAEGMVADKTEMCEGERLTVNGIPGGVINGVNWYVKTAAGVTASWKPQTSGNSTSIQIPEYGKYVLVADIDGVCTDSVKNFEVRVYRAPEIDLSAFPAYHCPDNEFYPGDFVRYKDNGNENVAVKWEVFAEGNPTDKVTVIGGNTMTPKLKFSEWGDYEIRVTLTNPTSCGPTDKLSASQVLHVVNPRLDVIIEADQKQICIGEKLTFTNTSSAAVEPAYSWSVTPGVESVDYEFTDGTDATHKAPHILFHTSGTYSVSGYVQGVCGGEPLPFTIVVKQDPKVTIDPLEAMCPGMLRLSDTHVHYVWNDSWNGGAESLRKVEWTLVNKPLNAEHTPYTSPEWDKLYPEIELRTPGEYTLQAKLVSAANCGGDLVATQKILIYDPEIYTNIKPHLDANVQDLGSGRYQTLQGEPLNFENTTTGVNLSYQWTVTPDVGYTISDKNADKPAITFNKYGEYKVRVDITGACKSDFREFTVVVKGVPSFVFDVIPNRCDNWEEVVDIRDYLHCDSAGSARILCNWTIVPADGVVAVGSNLSDMFPKLRFTRSGVYQLTLQAEAEYGGVRTVSGQVNVLKHTVVAKAELSQVAGCTTDGVVLHLTNRSEGDSLSYVWRVEPQIGWTGNLNVENPDLTFTDPGNYQVFLTAGNICGEQPVVYDFRAFSKPEVERLGAEDLGRQCERDYIFIGSEHVGEIRENNDELNYIRWKITPAGVNWENGTDASTRKPDMTFAGGKTYRIVGEFANHCKDTARIAYTLEVDKFEKVVLTQPDPLCAMSEPILLQATPEGGEWTTREAGMLIEKPGKQFYFDPNRNEESVVWTVYEYGNGTCIDKDSIRIKIRKLPVVDAGGDLDYCLNSGEQNLIGIEPAGLPNWFGNGVKNGSLFDPEIAGEGVSRLEYRYTDPLTGCDNLDTVFVTVHELPDAVFNVSTRQCRAVDSLYVPVELGKGHRFNWDFGNGDTQETIDAPASYRYPAIGEYPVTLIVTSVYNCVVEGTPQVVKVLNPPPTALFETDKVNGCGPLEVAFRVDPAHFAGDYYDLQYLWSFGNGNVTTDLQPGVQTFEPRLFDTTYQVTFKVYNVCGTEATIKDIAVYSPAVADFVSNPEDEGCTPLEVTFINRSTGSGNTYVWDFGDGETSQEEDPVHIFRTGTTMSVFEIGLTAVNRCTPDGSRATRYIKVKPNTILARFIKDKKYLCAGDTVCFENYSVDKDPTAALNYFWDFGDGEIAAVWDTCHRYLNAGVYKIKLEVDNGCASRQYVDSVVVHTIPVLQIEGENALCEDSELDLRLVSSEALKNITWNFGDGKTDRGIWQVFHAFTEPGIYEINVRGESNQIPSCPGVATKQVEVWPKPRVQIEPLDTVACPPFLYRPRVVATGYDYFRWDYGDDTGLTSDMEHLYENDTNFILEYAITAYVENNRGCKEEHSGRIKVFNGPRVAFDKDIAYGRPEKVTFINLSKDYTEFIWYLPDGRVVYSPEDQEVVFNEKGTYPLSMVGINEYGCRDSVYTDHIAYMGGLYFPNTFIPHNSNPKVNNFRGIGMGLKEYHLEIFDLYGNKIWETTALEDGEPSEGWDGRDKNGKLLPQGVYMWRAKAIFYSEDLWTGDNNPSGAKQSTQGTVLLLRK